jgi:hypothetical protein
MLRRRALALGGALILLILIVLGIKGCLDARANRELSDYASDVSQIVEETAQTSKAFFGKLEDPGELTVTEFVEAVKADRSAMESYASRVDGLGAPGDMGHAQSTLELVYQLRASAMEEIAAKMSTALGDAGAEKAVGAIANQMRKLLASDVIYETVTRPEIDGVLDANGIDDSDVPESSFIPDGDVSWLEESTIADALAAISGSSTEAGGPGIHGLGLVGVSVNGTELVEGGEATVAAEETVEVEVQVQNQGESTENGISVSVSVDGANTLEENISTISAGEIATATILLIPPPSGTVTLEVSVDTVPGEQVSENNEASYTVSFE